MHAEKHPGEKIISLGIGDTTEPIPEPIMRALVNKAHGMGTLEGYSGYGAEQGQEPLREGISSKFYNGIVQSSEIFVSDGSKCDIARLQLMFGPGRTIAVQDPAYPAYVDTSVMVGDTGEMDPTSQQFKGIVYMPCSADNDFFPDLDKLPATDLIFFCSPNNPTGAAATRAQLEKLVAFARKNGSIIIYDAAYAIFIEDENCPRSVFEIEGAKECAIETCSFSKYAGFTGVRLGWTVVPEALKFADGSSVQKDWNRLMSTCFNGASCISQAGGLACVQEEGYQAMVDLVGYYKENAKILKTCFEELGFSVYGGKDAPYVWVGFPGEKSWDVFADILAKCSIVTTPGSGFGPAGEGFVRASAFGHREDVLEAVDRLKKNFGAKAKVA